MARKKRSIIPVIIWILGLLGCIGYLYPLGYLSLLIPLLFWLFGSKFTKNHCEAYFNVLITGVIIYILGVIINKLLSLIDISFFPLKNIALIYLAIMCILGLVTALGNKRYNPGLVIKVF